MIQPNITDLKPWLIATLVFLSSPLAVNAQTQQSVNTEQPEVIAAQADYYSLRDAREFDKAGNDEMAIKIYRHYAMKGDDRAQFNLGVYYYEGEAIEEDLVKAYAWIKTSRTEHDPFGREQAMRGIYGALDEEQKQQADALAAKFLADYGSGKRAPMDLKVNLDLGTKNKAPSKSKPRDKINKHSKSKKDGRNIN